MTSTKRTPPPRIRFRCSTPFVLLALLAVLAVFAAAGADSDPAHVAVGLRKPLPWPGGVVLYDVSKLPEAQQKTVLKAMQRWTDTGARLRFVPRSNQVEYVNFTDYRSIMHYRTCWASRCESECKDGDGTSPCEVIDPVGKDFDRVIGQWTDNGISATDGEKLRLVYGSVEKRDRK